MYKELIKDLRENHDKYFACDMEVADVIEELSAKVDSLQIFVDNISKLPDCNNCLKKNMCEFMPNYGEYTRINCPAWLGVPEPPKEE